MYKYFNFKDKINKDEINKIAETIKNGGIGIFPTETVYGIGVDCFNESSVLKVYEVKKRPREKPLSVLVSNKDMIKEIAQDISKEEAILIEKFFPGPLTIILKKNINVSNIVTAGKDTIGVRMPENETALKIIDAVGRPLAVPSANISGFPSGVEYNQIIKDFKDNIDFFVDTGKSQIGISSTIVQIINGEVYIHREGVISKEDIENALKENKIKWKKEIQKNQSQI